MSGAASGADRPRFVLIFDGGSRGNPGAAYGSYRLQRTAAIPLPVRRVTFGHGTNNEAEYKALLAGLRGLEQVLTQAGMRSADVALEVRGDSRLVLEQLRGTWKVKNARLASLHREAESLLDVFGEVHLVHQDRGRSVKVLGH
jgi:probable phosphoglycerate mutase